MREAFLERQQLPFVRTEVAFGKERHRPAELQAVADAAEQRLRVLDRALDGNDPAGGADESPLGLAPHHAGRVREHVDARLDREHHQDRHRVEAAEVVGAVVVGGRAREVLAEVWGQSLSSSYKPDGYGAVVAVSGRGAADEVSRVSLRRV